MKPRRLRLLPAAHRDLERRTRFLRSERGARFAETYNQNLVGWLKRLANTGAIFGTAVEARPPYRTFGHSSQATILARFTDDEMIVARVHFRGQDWSRGR